MSGENELKQRAIASNSFNENTFGFRKAKNQYMMVQNSVPQQAMPNSSNTPNDYL